jgi:hypothetical protein
MMAGQADRRSSGQTGPTARRAAAGRPRANASRPYRTAIPVEVGIGGNSRPVDREDLAIPTVAPIPPDLVPRELPTQAAYRLLITSGISWQEAAGLISYVVGLRPCDSRWSLPQVNRLLFLRALYCNSDWGETERRPA